MLLLAGAGVWVFLPVTGRISVTEAAAVFLLPCGLVALARLPRARGLMAAGALWITGIVLAQFVHPADSGTVIKVLASAFVLTCTVGSIIGALTPRAGGTSVGPTARRLLVVGFAVGEMVGTALTPPADIGADPWKFGVGQAVAMVVLVWCDRLSPSTGRVVTPLIAVGIAGIDLLAGARSLSLLALVIGVAVLFAGRKPGRRGHAVLWLAGCLAAAITVSTVYTTLAKNGELGEAQQEKVSFQTGDFGLAVGGRKDFVYLVTAALDSPLLGWGASGVVPPPVKGEATQWLRRHGYAIHGYDLVTFAEPPALYQHSTILDAWIDGGIAGLPFWLLAVGLLARGLLLALRSRAIAEAYLVLGAIWHVFFSPLGDVTRGHIAVALALSVTALWARGKHHHDQPTHDRVSARGAGRWGARNEDAAQRHGDQPDGDTARENDADHGFLPGRL